MINFNTKTLKENPCYKIAEKVFSIDECLQIRSLYPHLTGNQINPSLTAGGLSLSKRNSENVWIPFEERWLYERVMEGLKQSNPWDCDLSGFSEMFQLTRYIEGSGYGWHQDHGMNEMSCRKISAVIQLSDPSEYEGEGLEIFGQLRDDKMHEQGSAVFFRSFEQHRMNPVYKGQRFSLVLWVSGPYWK